MKRAMILVAVAVVVLVTGAWLASPSAGEAQVRKAPQTAFALRDGPECICPWAAEEPTCDGPGSNAQGSQLASVAPAACPGPPASEARLGRSPGPSCDGHCGCKRGGP